MELAIALIVVGIILAVAGYGVIGLALALGGVALLILGRSSSLRR